MLRQLARSVNARGIGLGADLLTHAVRAANLASSVIGARALVAEAIDDVAGNFYLAQGFRQVAGRTGLFALPLH